MTVPGRLTVRPDGRVTGQASITWNDPWPCVNHGTGSGAMRGVIMHTMVGNLPGTVVEFNDPAKQVSAFFGIDQAGHIHQFLGVGLGEFSWAQEAGNLEWYSIEHADNGSTENPLTPAQIIASAQVVECLSAYAAFPLQVTDSTEGRGYGTHVMGGAAWGGHTCPGPGPRAGQRTAIIDLAKQIRHGIEPPPPPAAVSDYVTTGKESFAQVAQAHGTRTALIIRLTLEHDKLFVPHLATYIDADDLNAPMPKGITLRVPGPAIAIEPKARPVRKAAAAVRGAVMSTASAGHSAVRAEPAMTAGTAAGALSAGVALLQHKAGLHLSVTEVNAAITVIVAVAGIVTTVSTRPVRVGVIATALATLASAASTFGVHLPPAVVGGEMPVAALIAALLIRSHVSPKSAPGGTAVG